MVDAPIPAFNKINKLFKLYRETPSRVQPVVGWFCSYTPREILLAAGLHPYRLLPEPGQAMTRADSYIDRNFCPYVRTCLGEALEGNYRFLDGLVVVNSCDPMRRLYDVWRHNLGGDFVHLLDLPRVASPPAAAYFCECLKKLVAEIEARFHVKITDDALAAAIDSLNTSRRLLRELYRANRALSVTQVRKVVMASTVLSSDAFNALLERLLDESNASAADDRESPGILITGSVMDNPQILSLIEECGARVVGDDLCTGTRLFWDNCASTGEPLTDLACYYLGRLPCPRMKDAPQRFEHVLRIADELKVDGVIFYTLKFCDPFLFDIPLLKEKLTARGIPTLRLESDYTPGTLGRVRTRIEAFIEMLRQHVRTA